jgi:serine/threonine-protein kinase
MTTIDSVPMLLSVLRRVQLFAPEQVDEVERELGPSYSDPYDLAEYLVQIEWLTAFQFRMLFEGRWEELNVGPYVILDQLGEGGVSQVYKAWDTLKGRMVALKVLRQNLASRSDALRQFQRELETVTKLHHPNIIRTFDAQQTGAVHYFAMEFVEGLDLQRYVETCGPLPVDLACELARQTAHGLQHAHQLGLVHRDIKPANLIVVHPPVVGKWLESLGNQVPRRGPDPVVKILDWGLARLLRPPGETPTDVPTLPRTSDSLQAEKGLLIGTADYIAPEQARDATLVDTRADIYSLGCVLYFLLAGRPPFTSPVLMQKLLQHQEEPPTPIQQLRPEVPDDLAATLHRMLAKKPEERFQIPLLVVAALRRCSTLLPASGALRPPSSLSLSRPGSELNLSRPSSSLTITRPSSSGEFRRPH